MNRNIDYIIDEDSAGLRVEQFLRRKRYSGQNLSEIKRMPKSILVNGVHYYMRQNFPRATTCRCVSVKQRILRRFHRQTYH